MGRPDVGYWVVEELGQIAGFVTGGPIRYPIGEADCELYAIYVLPECQGKGAGTRLFRHILDHFLPRNWRKLGVLVLEGNPAVHFYHSLGFEKIDEASVTLGGADYCEHKMILKLSAHQ